MFIICFDLPIFRQCIRDHGTCKNTEMYYNVFYDERPSIFESLHLNQPKLLKHFQQVMRHCILTLHDQLKFYSNNHFCNFIDNSFVYSSFRNNFVH